MSTNGPHSQLKMSCEKYQHARHPTKKMTAALRTRSRSSARCCRNGIRPASSSASLASGSSSTSCGLAMLLGLRDRALDGLDHARELFGLGVVFDVAIGLAC